MKVAKCTRGKEIEVVHRNEEYKVIWKLDKSDIYSVKSAYNSIAINIMVRTEGVDNLFGRLIFPKM